MPQSIQYSAHHLGDGKRFLDAACGARADGIISKRIDCPYKPGNRGLWVKTKCINEEEFVIVGYSEPEGSRPYLGALLLAYYDDEGRLIYAGRAGTGRSQVELKRVYDKLQPLRISTMPLDNPAATIYAVWITADSVAGQMGEAEAGVRRAVPHLDE
jgi:ATP-dependent DNA ligase